MEPSVFMDRKLRLFVVLLLIGIVAVFVTVGGILYVKPRTPLEPKQVACTQEAKVCSDGTAVGRTGPNCEFTPCGTSNSPQPTASTTDTSTWKTYRNEEYGFEVKYPGDLAVRPHQTEVGAGSSGLELYDPKYVAPPGAVGMEIRSEFRKLIIDVYMFSQEWLVAFQKNVRENLQDTKDERVLPGSSVKAYILHSGLIGPYFSAYAYNDKYIFQFTSEYEDYIDDRLLWLKILSTFKFTN